MQSAVIPTSYLVRSFQHLLMHFQVLVYKCNAYLNPFELLLAYKLLKVTRRKKNGQNHVLLLSGTRAFLNCLRFQTSKTDIASRQSGQHECMVLSDASMGRQPNVNENMSACTHVVQSLIFLNYWLC